ncbi:MAG: hypothetical protein Ct9H90mP19_5010 [Gammaproteobacteria bacterium]|nr:MAG: hypothetical protein Ct9H90mP19_5010 [Gammaproteobacteria bacterium]
MISIDIMPEIKPLDGRKRGNRFSLGDEIKVFIGDIKELEGKISLYY